MCGQMLQVGNTQLGPRALTARSVVASTLLGVDPPELPTPLLVRSGTLFGIAEGTTRVALSRMVRAGELVAGEGSTYRLAGHLVDRQRRVRESRAARLQPWRGDWLLAVVTAERRDALERAGLREATARLRLAELREGVWARPDNLGSLTDPVVDEQCEWLTARPRRDLDPAVLWDLEGWAATADALRGDMSASLPSLEAGDTSALGPSFVLAAAVLRHVQADPLLPPELLPDGWPGPALRADYDGYESAFTARMRAWHRAQRSD